MGVLTAGPGIFAERDEVANSMLHFQNGCGLAHHNGDAIRL